MKDLRYEYEKLTEYIRFFLDENKNVKKKFEKIINEKQKYIEKSYNRIRIAIFSFIGIMITIIICFPSILSIGTIVISISIGLFLIFWFVHRSMELKTYESEDLLDKTYDDIDKSLKKLLEKILLQKILTTESEKNGIIPIIQLLEWGYNSSKILYNLKMLVTIHNNKLLGKSDKENIDAIFSAQQQIHSIAKQFHNIKLNFIAPEIVEEFKKIIRDNSNFFNFDDYNHSISQSTFTLHVTLSELMEVKYNGYLGFMKKVGYFKANEFINTNFRKKFEIDKNYEIISITK